MVKAASLTSALLVAKGDAAPADRPWRYEPGGTVQPLPARARRRSGNGKDDGTLRATLRMSAAEHLQLRLAAAHLNQSVQALMRAAIDHYLDTVLPPLMNGRCLCLEQGRAPGGCCPAANLVDQPQ